MFPNTTVAQAMGLLGPKGHWLKQAATTQKFLFKVCTDREK